MHLKFWGQNWRQAALAAAFLIAGQAIAADPDAVRYFEDAVSRFNSGDSKGALIQLRNALKRDPTQLPARVLIGRIHLDMGNPLEAEEALTTAEKLGADPVLTALPLAQARNRLHVFEVQTMAGIDL